MYVRMYVCMVCYRDFEYLTSCTHRQLIACLAAHVDLSDCPTCSESTPVHSHPVDSNPSLSKTCYQELLRKSHVYRDVECACHNFSTMYDSSNRQNSLITYSASSGHFGAITRSRDTPRPRRACQSIEYGQRLCQALPSSGHFDYERQDRERRLWRGVSRYFWLEAKTGGG